MYDQSKFVRRFHELKEEHKLSFEDMEYFTGISKRTIEGHYYGWNNPSVKSLYLLADMFRVSIDYLVGRSDDRGAK